MVTVIIITHYGGLLDISSKPHADLLKRSIAGLGSLGLIEAELICNKDTHTDTHMYISISFITFFTVLFYEFMHAPACPLLWWLYDDDAACHNPSILQKF